MNNDLFLCFTYMYMLILSLEDMRRLTHIVCVILIQIRKPLIKKTLLFLITKHWLKHRSWYFLTFDLLLFFFFFFFAWNLWIAQPVAQPVFISTKKKLFLSRYINYQSFDVCRPRIKRNRIQNSQIKLLKLCLQTLQCIDYHMPVCLSVIFSDQCAEILISQRVVHMRHNNTWKLTKSWPHDWPILRPC